MKIFFFLCALGSLSAMNMRKEDECCCIEEQIPCNTSLLRIRGDLLVWVAEASGLDTNFGSGSSTSTTSNGITTINSTEIDVDPSFHWKAGYRIALDWLLDRDRWEIEGLWTDFLGEATHHGKWWARLCQLDLNARYNLYFCDLHLQPFMGLRGSSIHQKLSSQVITQTLFIGSGIATDTRTFKDRQQFFGLGPLFGLNGIYELSCGVGFYGQFAFSLLYGNYHLHFNDSETVTAPATPNQIFSKIKKNMDAFDFNIDLALGIQWETLISDSYSLDLKLGVENHQYFNQSRLGYTFGNLSFSGVVFSAGLAF